MFIHPEISRELARDRQRDMLAQARNRHLARRLARPPAGPRQARLHRQPMRSLRRALAWVS